MFVNKGKASELIPRSISKLFLQITEEVYKTFSHVVNVYNKSINVTTNDTFAMVAASPMFTQNLGM